MKLPLLTLAAITTLALAWKGALGEDTTRRTLAIKASAVALIVAGIIGVSV